MVNDSLDQFELYLFGTDRKPSTIKWILKVTRHLLAHCQPFDRPHFNDYLLTLRRNNTKASHLNNYCSVAKIYAEFCKLQDFETLPHFKREKPIKEILTVAQIKQIVDCPKPEYYPDDVYYRWKNFFACCAWLGARPGEIARLKKQNILFNQQVIIIEEGKTGARRIPLPDALVPYLTDAVARCHRKIDAIFASREGHILTDRMWGREFNARLERCNIPKNAHITTYSLRHAAATRLVRKSVGSQIFTVKNILGHKNLSTTEQYFHDDIENMAQAMARDELSRSVISASQLLDMVTEKIDEFELAKDDRFFYQVTKTSNGLSINLYIK